MGLPGSISSNDDTEAPKTAPATPCRTSAHGSSTSTHRSSTTAVKISPLTRPTAARARDARVRGASWGCEEDAGERERAATGGRERERRVERLARGREESGERERRVGNVSGRGRTGNSENFITCEISFYKRKTSYIKKWRDYITSALPIQTCLQPCVAGLAVFWTVKQLSC